MKKKKTHFFNNKLFCHIQRYTCLRIESNRYRHEDVRCGGRGEREKEIPFRVHFIMYKKKKKTPKHLQLERNKSDMYIIIWLEGIFEMLNKY